MAETPSILKNPDLGHDEDYNYLITKGREYIESLAHELWTDYNEHDPGITILEALCYSITELGFRTSLPIGDLLSDPDGTIPSSQTFFTAKNILTQSALTADDYRKLLIDIKGVANAWLSPYRYDFKDALLKTPLLNASTEPMLYADCNADALIYTHSTGTKPVFLDGLYRVLLDLDNDPLLGDLNNGEIVVPNPAVANSFNASDISLTIVFPSWKERMDLSALPPGASTASVPVVTEISGKWSVSITFTAGVNTYTLSGSVTIDLKSANSPVTSTDIQAFCDDNDFTALVLDNYLQKVQKASQIVTSAGYALYASRNLCEDCAVITTVDDDVIAVCCDIDVAADTDMAFVQASVYLTIEQYLNPPVGFYLLREMIAKGYTVDEVFDGPKLAHGFIDTAELENSQLLTDIHASVIIERIMAIEGVLCVRNFLMTAYNDDGTVDEARKAQPWCIKVKTSRKPVLTEEKSKIVFYKDEFPYLAGSQEMQGVLQWLKSQNARNRLANTEDDYPVPAGIYFPLANYTSVQHLFPVTYGIGNTGLPPGATAARIAQARELKAYLLFYDQLLADFFSQLKNAGTLFSTDNIVQTYYAQFVSDFKDSANIYNSNNGGLANVLATQNSVTAANWQLLYEQDDVYTDRRNRFLDHLMARFAESFTEYVFMMYKLDYETQTETSIDPADLINSKIQFLQDYPDISYQRARGYNYLPLTGAPPAVDTSQLWDTDNVAGLEKKLCLLGGFKNSAGPPPMQSFFRRTLSFLSNAAIITTGSTSQYSFTVNGLTLTSVAAYNQTADALAASAGEFLPLAQLAKNYAVTKKGAKWELSVIDSENNIVVKGTPLFGTKTAALAMIPVLVDEFNKECDHEGLHLIEHILLRPRDTLFDRAPVCLEPGCDFCGDEDPYSFRITIVLPYWPAHFQNMAFREYFEDLARTEAPAHCTVRVCWINDASMQNFEIVYQQWIAALANYMMDKTNNVNALQSANDKLIGLLFDLHSEYPVATLHDCDESKDTNPVMLGKTILGNLKT